jgi:hypothetical protein
LFGQLWNFLGDLVRKLISGKENVFEGALLGKEGPNFLIPLPQSYTGWNGPVSLYYNN